MPDCAVCQYGNKRKRGVATTPENSRDKKTASPSATENKEHEVSTQIGEGRINRRKPRPPAVSETSDVNVDLITLNTTSSERKEQHNIVVGRINLPPRNTNTELDVSRSTQPPIVDSNGILEGEVHGYSVSPLPNGFIDRVYRLYATLFRWEPFPLGWIHQNFNLVNTRVGLLGDGQHAKAVVIYGENLNGTTISNNNQLKLRGRDNKSRVFVASSVENVSTKTIIQQRVVPPSLMWVIVLIVVSTLIYAAAHMVGVYNSIVAWRNSGALIEYVTSIITLVLVLSLIGSFLGLGSIGRRGLAPLGCLFRLLIGGLSNIFTSVIIIFLLATLLPEVFAIIFNAFGPIIVAIVVIRLFLRMFR